MLLLATDAYAFCLLPSSYTSCSQCTGTHSNSDSCVWCPSSSTGSGACQSSTAYWSWNVVFHPWWAATPLMPGQRLRLDFSSPSQFASSPSVSASVFASACVTGTKALRSFTKTSRKESSTNSRLWCSSQRTERCPNSQGTGSSVGGPQVSKLIFYRFVPPTRWSRS